MHRAGTILVFLSLFAIWAAAATRSVWDGVYTKEQAARGEQQYLEQCARCHGENLLGGEDSPLLVDEEFLSHWYGLTVGDLVERVRKTMPTDGPGVLSRQRCTDIVAYMLSANYFPAGESELESDLGVLNQIRIEPKR